MKTKRELVINIENKEVARIPMRHAHALARAMVTLLCAPADDKHVGASDEDVDVEWQREKK